MTSLECHPVIGSDKPWRAVMRAVRVTGLGACVAILAFSSRSALAAPSCSFTTVTGVNFGIYDVFASSSNNSGVGTLRISCTGGGPGSFPVTLSTGQSNSYASRVLKSGTNQLNYNLYTNAARTTIWGDGTGVSSNLTAARNATTTLTVYGQIPAGQDVGVGTYTDSITATVTF